MCHNACRTVTILTLIHQLPDISQLSALKRPSYPNGLLDSIESGLCRRDSCLRGCSIVPLARRGPWCLRHGYSGPFPRSVNPCPARIINVSLDRDGHSRFLPARLTRCTAASYKTRIDSSTSAARRLTCSWIVFRFGSTSLFPLPALGEYPFALLPDSPFGTAEAAILPNRQADAKRIS